MYVINTLNEENIEKTLNNIIQFIYKQKSMSLSKLV